MSGFSSQVTFTFPSGSFGDFGDDWAVVRINVVGGSAVDGTLTALSIMEQTLNSEGGGLVKIVNPVISGEVSLVFFPAFDYTVG